MEFQYMKKNPYLYGPQKQEQGLSDYVLGYLGVGLSEGVGRDATRDQNAHVTRNIFLIR